MNFNCECCNKIVRTTAITGGGTDPIALEIPAMKLSHGQFIRICFAQIPPTVDSEPVPIEIKVGADSYKVFNTRMIGARGAISTLNSDQLDRKCNGEIRARQYIDVVFSTETSLFNYVGPRCTLCRSNVEYPPVPAPTPKNKVKVEK